MRTIFKVISIAVITPIAAMSLSGCATISEGDCVTGSWQDIGYKDGRKGKSRGRFADIAKTCNKYNIVPDRTAYMKGYDQGLPLYCTYDTGYDRGADGSSINRECSGAGFTGYIDGHAEGRIFYDIKSEHQDLIAQYEDSENALIDVRRRLSEGEMDADETKRLRKKAYRLETLAEDLRIDIRAMERVHSNLPRYDFY